MDVLYSFRRCPYAMRARLALWVAGDPVQLREVVLRNKPQALLDVSPKGTVPVWVGSDGRVVDESVLIMLQTLEARDPLGWLPRDGEEDAQIMALIAHNDGPFKLALDRFKYTNRYEGVDREAERQILEGVLTAYEARLQGGWLVGGRRTLADVALAPFVRQLAFAEKPWFDAGPWPKVRAWLDDFLQWPVFLAVMKKLPPWEEGQDVVVFPWGEPV